MYKPLLKFETEEHVKECMIKERGENSDYNIRKEQWEPMWTKELKFTFSYDLKEIFHKVMSLVFNSWKTFQNVQRCFKCLMGMPRTQRDIL